MSEGSLALTLSLILLWILVILHSLLLMGIVRRIQNGLASGEGFPVRGLEPGEKAPALEGLVAGSSDPREWAGVPRALLFLSPNCPACAQVLADGLGVLRRLTEDRLALICRGTQEACAQIIARHRRSLPILLDPEGTLYQRYRIAGVPSIVLVGADDRVILTLHPEPLGRMVRAFCPERAISVPEGGSDGE